MSSEETRSKTGQQYAVAHKAHYTTKDLPGAFEIYKNIITGHPDSAEARYSRAQVRNIVNVVIPEQELLDTHIDLVLARFEGGEHTGAGSARTSNAG